MKLGLIADSHDHFDHLNQALAWMRQQGVERVLHAGDYVSPGAVNLFQGMPLSGVLGNNDGDLLHLNKVFASIGGELLGDFGTITLAGRTIGLYHGVHRDLKEALIHCGTYDVLVFGHTHRLENRQVGRTLVLNPGTVHGFFQSATAMILHVEDLTVEVLELGRGA